MFSTNHCVPLGAHFRRNNGKTAFPKEGNLNEEEFGIQTISGIGDV